MGQGCTEGEGRRKRQESLKIRDGSQNSLWKSLLFVPNTTFKIKCSQKEKTENPTAVQHISLCGKIHTLSPHNQLSEKSTEFAFQFQQQGFQPFLPSFPAGWGSPPQVPAEVLCKQASE